MIQALFGYLGFLTWQEDTQEVIVNNIDGFFKIIVNLILVAKALLSYPLPYYAACDLIEKEMFQVRLWVVYCLPMIMKISHEPLGNIID